MSLFIADGTDAISFLNQQHQQIRGQFLTVLRAAGQERIDEFHGLRRMLALHEAAEEIVVHPVARKTLEGGERIVAARLAEEHAAKQALAELETLDCGSARFDELLRKLQTDVLAHADAEEAQELQPLHAELSANQLTSMLRAIDLWEGIAPTRPHPGIESPATLKLAGPFLSMFDRVRDYLTNEEPAEV